MNKRKALAFLALNATIVILELIGTTICFNEIGAQMLIFYTQLSNLFLLIAATINSYFAVRALKDKKYKIPTPAYTLFYAATCATTVTLLTVIFVLSWMYGDLIYILTAGSMLFTHTLCPVLALITHFAFTPKALNKNAASRALLFTLFYGGVAIVLNITETWHGPYPFLYIYEQPVWASFAWFVGIICGAYGIARLLLIGKTRKK
jgi:hypothetical protein